MREVVLEGFSNYVINDSGDNDKTVWSKIKNCWLTPTNNGGHLRFSLTNDNGVKTKKYIHQLLAEAFIPNLDGYSVVHHKDHNPINNSLDNLEWVNPQKHAKIHHQGNTYFLGKHHTEEYKQKMSDVMKGEHNPMFGKTKPESSGVPPKQVFQYSLDGNLIKIWKSTLECGTQFDRSAVSKCCHKKYSKDGNKYKGYIWSFIPL